MTELRKRAADLADTLAMLDARERFALDRLAVTRDSLAREEATIDRDPLRGVRGDGAKARYREHLKRVARGLHEPSIALLEAEVTNVRAMAAEVARVLTPEWFAGLACLSGTMAPPYAIPRAYVESVAR